MNSGSEDKVAVSVLRTYHSVLSAIGCKCCRIAVYRPMFIAGKPANRTKLRGDFYLAVSDDFRRLNTGCAARRYSRNSNAINIYILRRIAAFGRCGNGNCLAIRKRIFIYGYRSVFGLLNGYFVCTEAREGRVPTCAEAQAFYSYDGR